MKIFTVQDPWAAGKSTLLARMSTTYGNEILTVLTKDRALCICICCSRVDAHWVSISTSVAFLCSVELREHTK